jgi:hypothetical protein
VAEVPYSICELEGKLVLQVMVADVAVIPLDVTALIVGIAAAPAFTVRNSSAAAAQGAEDETEAQVTEDCVAAVLSHKAVSAKLLPVPGANPPVCRDTP